MSKLSIYLLTSGFLLVLNGLTPAIAQATVTRIKDIQHNRQAAALHGLTEPILAQQEPTDSQNAAPSPTTDIATTPRPRDGFYFSVSGDARFVTKATISPIDAGISLSPGFGINSALGYRFKNNLRVEGEFSYGSNNVDEVSLPTIPGITTTVTNPAIPLTIANPITTPIPIAVPGFGTIPAGTTIPAGVVLNPGPPLTNATPINLGVFTIPAGTDLSALPGITTTGGVPGSTTTIRTPDIPAATLKVDGKITTISGLVNLYYDIPTGSRFEPYVGGGVGVSGARADNLSASYPGTTINYDISGGSTVFVYQLRAGVAYQVSDNSAVSLGYRYFNVAKQSFDVEPLGELEVDGLGVHNIELGFRYFF